MSVLTTLQNTYMNKYLYESLFFSFDRDCDCKAPNCLPFYPVLQHILNHGLRF